MGNTYYFAYDDNGIQFSNDIWDLLDQDGVLVKDCYVYVHDGHTYFPDTKEAVEENVFECKEVKATEWLKQQNEKVADLEASLQSTENYWKSKYELEVDKVADLQSQLEEKDAYWNDWLNSEFGDNLYPLDPPEPDEFVEKVKKLQTDVEDFEYDLQSLQSDLKQLDTLMDDLHGVSEYDDIADMITEIQSFLKVCDRNSDGHYEHYETRQIATRVEGGVYQSLKS